MVPTLASCSLKEMTDVRIPGQTQWFQLYVNPDREIAKQLVQAAESRGCTALVITVDAPALGRREKDMRMKFIDDVDVKLDTKADRSQGNSQLYLY
jgi:L-lactate dehydrogenase (cytochrome)